MSVKEERNWAEFDKDMLSLIFQKVGAIDILRHAQYVCKPWRNLSFDPSIWKVQFVPDLFFFGLVFHDI